MIFHNNNMVAVNKLESLLVVPLLVLSISAQENSGYGSTSFSSSGGDFTGTSAPSGFGGIGPSGGPTARARIGPSTPTGRGRVVNNSILDFEQDPEDRDNGSRQGYSRQQSGFSPRPIITTGPSVGGSQYGLNSLEEKDTQGQNLLDEPNLSNVQQQKIYRFVSVHVPPIEPSTRRPRPTQAAVKPETHYQIVFIKAPTPSTQELQEIQLPPPPEMKTLVYVLLKKPEMSDLVKISERPKPKPNKPEVFFIRYKPGTQRQQQQNQERRQQLPQQQQEGIQFPQIQQDARSQFPQTQQEGRQPFPQTQQDGMQQFPQTQQEGIRSPDPKPQQGGRRPFPQTQQEGKQQFPQIQQNGRSQFPQTQQEGRKQFPQIQQNGKSQFPQTQQEGRQQFPQIQQNGRSQFPQTQQEMGRQQFPQLQRTTNNGSINVNNNILQQQQNTGSVPDTSVSPIYGGYESSTDSVADSDYQHETSDENSFSLSSYDQDQQGILPEYSYTPTSQYGITS